MNVLLGFTSLSRGKRPWIFKGGELMNLKPCPFCGGKPHMAQNYLGQKYVRCPECGACVWGKDTDDWRIDTMGEKKAEKAAAEAWNRRANDV